MAETTVTSPPSAVLRALGVTMGGAGRGLPGAQTEQCLGLMGALVLGRYGREGQDWGIVLAPSKRAFIN